MGDYRAIADVGETLITLLRDNMGGLINPDSIVLLSPAEVEGQNIRLTLFLYTVMENPHLKNQEMRNISPTQLGYPPLTLDLYYLLTAYASTQIPDRTEQTLEQHRILGRAMRIFYDNGILSGTILQGSLSGTSEELRVVLNPISVDDLTKIWSAFQEVGYRLSVSYLVSPTNIDSTRDMSMQRVVSKEMNHSFMVPRR
jgi:Pvc16 N-terminal domain